MSEKGDLALKDISEYVGRSIPSVRNVKNNVLEKLNMKICGLVDYKRLSEINSKIILFMVGANVANSFSSKSVDISSKIAEFSEVSWVCSVSGKYDLMIQALSTRGMRGVKEFLKNVKLIVVVAT